MIKEGTILEFESGNKFEVLKVWNQRLVDLKAMQPLFEWIPDYFPIYLSVNLKDFKILNVEKNERREE